MNEPKKNTNYSLDDIEQYMQGKLSPAEMHNIEKAAVQDPFLADAIDGFVAADLAMVKTDLNQINSHLESGTAKVITVAAKTMAWWKIAAAVVVIAGTGVAGFTLFFNQKNEKLDNEAAAQQLAAKPVLKDSVVSEVLAGLIEKPVRAAKESNDRKENPGKELKTMADQKELNPVLSRQRVVVDNAAKTEDLRINANSGAQILALSEKKVKDAKERSKTIPDKEVADKIQSISASVNIGGGNLTSVGNLTMTPNYEFYSRQPDRRDSFIVRNDTLVPLSHTAGFISSEIAKKAEYEARFAAKTISLGEVMIPTTKGNIYLGSRSQTNLIAKAVSKKDTTSYLLVMEPGVLEPEGGWENFNTYFHDKLFAGKDSIPGKIVMTMRLNNNGKVVNADFSSTDLRSFDNNLKKSAIDALLKGPRWSFSGKFQAYNVATYIEL